MASRLSYIQCSASPPQTFIMHFLSVTKQASLLCDFQVSSVCFSPMNLFFTFWRHCCQWSVGQKVLLILFIINLVKTKFCKMILWHIFGKCFKNQDCSKKSDIATKGRYVGLKMKKLTQKVGTKIYFVMKWRAV